MLPRLKPEKFYDLVIEVAIVRPGPIQGDMVHPYLRRRSGTETVVYPAPAPAFGEADELEQVLGKTLGVPLFQEQAMKIAIVAAGFTPGEADKLRRAMATFKRVGTIGTFQKKMVEGMVARGYERDFAERCFHQIEGFGEYGFPESHAASFALLVYASAWLKCHYPDVFCAALLNAQPMGFYAPAQIVRDAQRHGVVVRAPDVNASDWDSTLEPLDDPHGTASSTPLAEVSGSARSESDHDPLMPSPFQGEGEPAAASSSQAASLAIADKPRRSQQMPPPLEKGRMGGDLQEARSAGGATGTQTIFTTHAVRLGLRQIKGFREDDARAADDGARGGLRFGARPVAAHRPQPRGDRAARRWRCLPLAGSRPARRAVGGARPGQGGERDRLPLFDVAAHGDIRREPDFPLPPMPIGEHVVNDYRYLHLSLKAHPLSFLRETLAARRIVANSALKGMEGSRPDRDTPTGEERRKHDRDTARGEERRRRDREIKNGDRVTVAGLVIIRQRPGTAKGVIFMTLEDETDIANAIVWPKTFERFRPIVLGARLIAVTGRVQSESGVIHVVADRLEDLTPAARRPLRGCRRPVVAGPQRRGQAARRRPARKDRTALAHREAGAGAAGHRRGPRPALGRRRQGHAQGAQFPLGTRGGRGKREAARGPARAKFPPMKGCPP